MNITTPSVMPIEEIALLIHTPRKVYRAINCKLLLYEYNYHQNVTHTSVESATPVAPIILITPVKELLKADPVVFKL